MSIKTQPQTRKGNVVETIHGVEVADPYRWFEEENDEIVDWVARQNRYTQSFLKNIPERPAIFTRLKKLFAIDTVSVPVPIGDRYFFEERKGFQDLPVLYVQDGLNGIPRVLIDPSTLSKDRKTLLRDWRPSRDGRLLAYSVSEQANDQANIRVMDVESGEELEDFIPPELYPGVYTRVEWNMDGTGFWYTHRSFDVSEKEGKFHQKIYFHKLGRDYREDTFVLGEEFKKEDVPVIRNSYDGKYLVVTVHTDLDNVSATEIYLKDLENPDSDFIPVIRGKKAEFYPEIHRDTIYITTNHRAPYWKTMAVKISDISRGIRAWRTIIPETEHTHQGVFLVRDTLFALSLENVHSVLRRHDLEGKLLVEVKLPTLGSLSGIAAEREGKELFFGFSSFTVPHTVYRMDLESGSVSCFKKANAGFDPDTFKVKQVWYSSKDGTRIPMFLVQKKGIRRNGKNPVMLYGYGGFNVNQTPDFRKTIIPFIEAGGMYVIANIRGGGEFGEVWHKAGMGRKRQNVFDDFIAAAEWLIGNRYTSKDRLAIFGWSNGGLLTATVLTQRPDLFKAVVIGAPVIDMLRYHLFYGGRHWIPDYGDPDDPKMAKYLLRYSPYHNVKDGEEYPATLIVTADRDDRVHPMHGYKMAARLQEANASKNPILIRIETKTGHGGAAAVSHAAEQYADLWAFVFWQLGMYKSR